MRIKSLVIAIAMILPTLDAYAGPARAGSFGSRSSASITSIASRPSIKSAASTAAAKSTANSASSSNLGGSKSAPKTASSMAGAQPSRPSMLDRSGPAPSPALAERIRTEERSSGPGWIGTAFLISLFSSHDLSASDRSWMQSRIDEANKDEMAKPEVVNAVELPDVEFWYMTPSLPPKQSRPYEIRAQARAGDHSIPVRCEFPEGVITQNDDDSTLRWTPTRSGSQVLTCRAGGLFDQRLLMVD